MMALNYNFKAGDWVKIGKGKNAMSWEILGIHTHIPRIEGGIEVALRNENKTLKKVSIFKIREVVNK